MSISIDHRLERILRRTLPRARLQSQALELCPEIRLHLLALDSVRRLSHEEAAAVMESPPYWTLCWASGQVLARWLLDHPGHVRGRRVVDMGTGSGVVAIAAAMAGAARVIAVDSDPHAREAAHANALLNRVPIQVSATLPGARKGDLLLLADVLYDRDNLELIDHLSRRYRRILIAESRLRPLPLAHFALLHEASATTVPDVDEHRDFNRVALYGMGLSGANWTSAQRSINGRASA